MAAERFELEYIRPREGWILVANGPGPRLAGAAVDAVRGEVDVIVSTGICGALDPALRIADIFVATAVNGTPCRIPAGRRRCTSGPLLSIDRVASTSAEKSRLFAEGAMAVEMEAAAVAAKARVRGAEFYCVRAISDVADESFALDLNAARDADGRFQIGAILGQAFRRPVTGFPELLRLRRNAAAASKALGEFFADCEL